MAQNTVTIKDIVKEFMMGIDAEDYIYGTSESIIRNNALRGIRDMGFDMLKVIKSKTIDVKENNTAVLPDDFVSITKVGLVSDEGQVLSLIHI